MGICVIDAGGDGRIAGLAKLFKNLGKQTFTFCDNQSAEAQKKIAAEVDKLFMHNEKGIEDLVLKNTTSIAMKHFVELLKLPPHLTKKYPDPKVLVTEALKEYFTWSKGNWSIADFLAQCNEDEIPQFIRDTCVELRKLCDPTPSDLKDTATVAFC